MKHRHQLLSLLLLCGLGHGTGALAAPSAMGCLKIVNKDNAMLWENHCGHAILVAFCSPNEAALESRCGQGKAADNPFYTHQFTIAAGGVQARYHHQIMRYDYAVCPAAEGMRVVSDHHGGFTCE